MKMEDKKLFLCNFFEIEKEFIKEWKFSEDYFSQRYTKIQLQEVTAVYDEFLLITKKINEEFFKENKNIFLCKKINDKYEIMLNKFKLKIKRARKRGDMEYILDFLSEFSNNVYNYTKNIFHMYKNFDNDNADRRSIEIGNFFETREECEEVIRKIKEMLKS